MAASIDTRRRGPLEETFYCATAEGFFPWAQDWQESVSSQSRYVAPLPVDLDWLQEQRTGVSCHPACSWLKDHRGAVAVTRCL
jgi:hypothetical protein